MKILTTVFCLLVFLTSQGQADTTPTLKSILIEQLKSTHSTEEWFVPVNIAVEGLTAEQANWSDKSENHSIAQLLTHLNFWNKQSLDKFKGVKPDAFNGNNKETFTKVTNVSWTAAVKEFDDIMTEWENLINSADDAKLKKWYSTIAHIGAHNAYHTGQIIYIRKMKGWWNADKGVK